MKPLAEQDHYEVLEVSRSAGPEEIERGYRVARSIYEEGNEALYSVFDDADAREIRGRIEAAYEVLSDPDARRRYDERVAGGGSAELRPPEPAEPTPEREASPPPGDPPFEETELEADSGVFDGPRLRRSRLRRGMEVERVAEITKISASYLHFIEEERFERLPAGVYVRGFVKAYARCVGLDPLAASRDYMERWEAARDEGGPRWFRARR